MSGGEGAPPQQEVASRERADAHPAPADGHGSSHRILRPAGWPRGSGYADGILASGRILVTAGQIGWDAATHDFVSDTLADQVRQALGNVLAVLREGGAGPEHLVRLTWYLTDRAEYLAQQGEIGRAYRETVGRHFPAMAIVIVAGLVEVRAKVEIEAMAVLPP
jgi:enamine deaminase RidA (YjgF/YER057c/UK114 family)